LFQPKKADILDEPDYIVKNLQKGKLYPSEVEVMTFNINGEYLAVGTFDGIIEIYDPETYELMPFDFQNTNNFMNHLSSSL
jgi:WD40 repeat protein